MPADPSIREISVEFARTITSELCIGDDYFEIEVYGPGANECEGCIQNVRQSAEDMIERYIRRAIEADRKARTPPETEVCQACDAEIVR